MVYSVKWIEENLGVTRLALQIYEERKLIPRVLSRRKCEYSEDDINVIWTIKMLRNIGYCLKEVAFMIKTPEFDFERSIEEKIVRLGKEREEKEQQLEYAKTLKKTGKFPVMPKEIGVMEVKIS